MCKKYLSIIEAALFMKKDDVLDLTTMRSHKKPQKNKESSEQQAARHNIVKKIKSHNPQSESLAIGDFEISQSSISDNKIWICFKSGEGSEFDKVHFSKAIGKYYNENF